MFYTYILYSKSIDKYYIGYSENLDLRIKYHNLGSSKFTSKGIPWVIAYKDLFRSNEMKY